MRLGRSTSGPAVVALAVVSALAVPSLGSPAPTDEGVGLRGSVSEPESDSVVWVEREVRAMGTRLRIRLGAPDRATGIRATEAALDAVRDAESLLSTWRPDTELARLNGAAVGEAVVLSPELARILGEARSWARRTDGAFEPAVGALVDAWGLRHRGGHPSEEALTRAVAASGSAAFVIRGDEGVATRRDALAWIDAGAFGKGYALRRAVRALERAGTDHALLDFGGQIATLGRPSHGATDAGRSWPVSVAHPNRRAEPAVELAVEGGTSVSTTGGSERFVVSDGRTFSHVIDPRSGRPVPPWGSVTVVAEDAMVADLMSTALFVLGPDQALEWAEEREDVAALVLTAATEEHPARENGSETPVGARWTPAMEAYLADGSVWDGGGSPASPEDMRSEGPDEAPGSSSRRIDDRYITERRIRGTP